MPQDSTKVVMGATLSSVKDVEEFNVDPASFPAGRCVSMGSDGLPSLLKSAGFRMGVSLGKSLSDTKKTAILRTGLKVPIRAAYKRATGTITVTNYAHLVNQGDDTLTVGETVFTAGSGAATPGDATFQAATSNNATATSLAAQINAHADAGALVYATASAAVVTLYARNSGTAGNVIALSYSNVGDGAGITLAGLSDGKLSGGSDALSDIAYMVKGSKMYINDVSGIADIAIAGFSTVTDAIYVEGPKTGVFEDGTEYAAAIVDMIGGL